MSTAVSGRAGQFHRPVADLPRRGFGAYRLHGCSEIRQALRGAAGPVRSLRRETPALQAGRLPRCDARRRRRTRFESGYPAVVVVAAQQVVDEGDVEVEFAGVFGLEFAGFEFDDDVAD